MLDKLKKIKIPGDTSYSMFIGCTIAPYFLKRLKSGIHYCNNRWYRTISRRIHVIYWSFLSFKNVPSLFRGGVISVNCSLSNYWTFSSKIHGDSLFGLSSLAIIGAMSVANNALYSGIMSSYGDEIDQGAVAMTTISVGPTVTMIALSSSGQANIPIMQIIGSILPLVIGMILGNVSPFLKKHLTSGITPIIIILGFVLGANMNFKQLIAGGFSGILLGLIVAIVGGFFGILADRLTGGTGVAGAGINSTAASAVATPASMAAIDPTLATSAAIATPQIAASVIVTSLLTPFTTSLVYKWNQKKLTSK